MDNPELRAQNTIAKEELDNTKPDIIREKIQDNKQFIEDLGKEVEILTERARKLYPRSYFPSWVLVWVSIAVVFILIIILLTDRMFFNYHRI